MVIAHVHEDTLTTVCPQDEKDEHQLTLARLEWELQQRIKLADVLCQHEILNGENMENIRKKQELLARLRSSMSSVLESMAPIAADLLPDAERNAAGADGDVEIPAAPTAVKEELPEPMETI